MQKIYSKDECAPDAQSARSWIDENIGDLAQANKLVIHQDDEIIELFWFNGVFYKVEF